MDVAERQPADEAQPLGEARDPLPFVRREAVADRTEVRGRLVGQAGQDRRRIVVRGAGVPCGLVQLGEEVAAGQKLLSLEAMKMETTLYAERAAAVAEVLAEPGTQVEAGDLLLRFDG